MLAAVPSDCCQTTCMLPVGSMATRGGAVMSSARVSRSSAGIEPSMVRRAAIRLFGVVVPEAGWRHTTTASPLALIAAAGSAAAALVNELNCRANDQVLVAARNSDDHTTLFVPLLCTQVAMALPEAAKVFVAPL